MNATLGSLGWASKSNCDSDSGTGEMRARLAEIRRQGIQTVFSIEAFYTEPPDQAMNSMRKSLAHFENLAAEITNE